ncbi:MAG: GtrA family protein [Gammaproteobacteria bacterium]|nr:GtrA family protein [Gammaproteobacteria bacterium]
MLKQLLTTFLTREFSKFAFIGICNTVIYATIFLILTSNHLPQFLANIIAFLTATSFSCIANTAWSFREKISFKIAYKFYFVSTIGLVTSTALSGCADLINLNHYLTIMVLVAIMPPLNFIGHRHWTYRT